PQTQVAAVAPSASPSADPVVPAQDLAPSSAAVQTLTAPGVGSAAAHPTPQPGASPDHSILLTCNPARGSLTVPMEFLPIFFADVEEAAARCPQRVTVYTEEHAAGPASSTAGQVRPVLRPWELRLGRIGRGWGLREAGGLLEHLAVRERCAGAVHLSKRQVDGVLVMSLAANEAHPLTTGTCSAAAPIPEQGTALEGSDVRSGITANPTGLCRGTAIATAPAPAAPTDRHCSAALGPAGPQKPVTMLSCNPSMLQPQLPVPAMRRGGLRESITAGKPFNPAGAGDAADDAAAIASENRPQSQQTVAARRYGAGSSGCLLHAGGATDSSIGIHCTGVTGVTLPSVPRKPGAVAAYPLMPPRQPLPKQPLKRPLQPLQQFETSLHQEPGAYERDYCLQRPAESSQCQMLRTQRQPTQIIAGGASGPVRQRAVPGAGGRPGTCAGVSSGARGGGTAAGGGMVHAGTAGRQGTGRGQDVEFREELKSSSSGGEEEGEGEAACDGAAAAADGVLHVHRCSAGLRRRAGHEGRHVGGPEPGVVMGCMGPIPEGAALGQQLRALISLALGANGGNEKEKQQLGNSSSGRGEAVACKASTASYKAPAAAAAQWPQQATAASRLTCPPGRCPADPDHAASMLGAAKRRRLEAGEEQDGIEELDALTRVGFVPMTSGLVATTW
ncbi:hypothetical protein Agub_g6142, partial [Astrephomene gubernaculifera]